MATKSSAPTISYLQVEGGTLDETFRIEPFTEKSSPPLTPCTVSTYKIVEPFEADMQ